MASSAATRGSPRSVDPGSRQAWKKLLTLAGRPRTREASCPAAYGSLIVGEPEEPGHSRACEPRNPVTHADKVLVPEQERDAIPAAYRSLLVGKPEEPSHFSRLRAEVTFKLTSGSGHARRFKPGRLTQVLDREHASVFSEPEEPSHSRACELRLPSSLLVEMAMPADSRRGG